MPADMCVPIPAPGEYLQLYFNEMVENDGFGLALDFSAAEFDELAQMTDLQVTGAEATEAGVAVHYTVSWEAFHACDDRTVGRENARVVRGTVDGCDWLFERAAPSAGRSTVDEF
ncbi:hypothetical protein [Roseateles sp. BYS78W]